MSVISPAQVGPGELEQELRSATRPLLIDVCSPGEFATGHLAGSMNIPLEELGARAADIAWNRNMVIVCRTGTRAGIAQQSLSDLGLSARVLAGGLGAWSTSGRPLVRSAASHWALERQVRFAAGVMVVAGLGLSYFAGRAWVGLAGFAGLGLTLSGVTGLCPMASILARMPWNRLSAGETASGGVGCGR